MTAPVPARLVGRPFTCAQALEAGVSRRMLSTSRYVALFRGVYHVAGVEPDLSLLLDAARLVTPRDAAASHLTALRIFGFEFGPVLPLHFSTNTDHCVERPGIRLHRRQGELNAVIRDGQRVLGPMRTFIDVATVLNDRQLMRVGDWMVTHGLVKLDVLRDYVHESHLNGVQRARRVAVHIRAGAASPSESDVRWIVREADLPEPELNVDIHDDDGQWLARGDLVYRRWKVLVEYDGWQHERDARQRQWDHLRRERLEHAGWRVVVITAEDLKHPQAVADRVRSALRQRGCPC